MTIEAANAQIVSCQAYQVSEHRKGIGLRCHLDRHKPRRFWAR